MLHPLDLLAIALLIGALVAFRYLAFAVAEVAGILPILAVIPISYAIGYWIERRDHRR